jgi:hypothetical protein
MKGAEMTSKPRSTKVHFYRPRSRYVQVRFGEIVQVLAMIESNGQSRKLANKTRGDEHKIRIPSATVIAVKELVAAHPEMGRSALGKRVLYAKKVARRTENAAVAKTQTVPRSAASSVATGDNDCCQIGTGG